MVGRGICFYSSRRVQSEDEKSPQAARLERHVLDACHFLGTYFRLHNVSDRNSLICNMHSTFIHSSHYLAHQDLVLRGLMITAERLQTPSRLAFNLFPHWNNDNASTIICISDMKIHSTIFG
jgi:hypothetical protein